MWSNKTDSLKETIDWIPSPLGLHLDPQAYLMIMVVYEGINESFNDFSGLELFYRQDDPEDPLKAAKKYPNHYKSKF